MLLLILECNTQMPVCDNKMNAKFSKEIIELNIDTWKCQNTFKLDFQVIDENNAFLMTFLQSEEYLFSLSLNLY